MKLALRRTAAENATMAGSPANTDGIRAYIDELVIVKGWAGDLSGMTSEIVL